MAAEINAARRVRSLFKASPPYFIARETVGGRAPMLVACTAARKGYLHVDPSAQSGYDFRRPQPGRARGRSRLLLVRVVLGGVDGRGEIASGESARLLALGPIQLLVDLLLRVAVCKELFLGRGDHVRVAADVRD